MSNNKSKRKIYLLSSLFACVILFVVYFTSNKEEKSSIISRYEHNKIEESISRYSLSDTILKTTTKDKINQNTEDKENKLDIEQNKKNSTDKIAYITIDDGPSKYTNQILDILNSNNVKATFFMLDKKMKSYKEEVMRIVNEGHAPGFHSVTHDIHKLYESPQSTLDEFNTCKNTFFEITGTNSDLIRLPYGSKPYAPEKSYNELVESGYMIWDWNLDTQDWNSNSDQIVSNILYYAREKKELIILMHEKEQTVNSLNSMIKILKDRGYKILSLPSEKEAQNFWNRKLE